MRSPTFCIYGAGAIGGTIAAYLTRTDATVSVVARGETLAALKMHGLRLISDGQIVKGAHQGECGSLRARAAGLSASSPSRHPLCRRSPHE